MVIDSFNYKEILPKFFDTNTRLDPATEVIFEVNGNFLHYRVACGSYFLAGVGCWNKQIFMELRINAMEFCSELGVDASRGAFPVMKNNQDFLRVIYHLFMRCEEYTIPPIELMDINLSFEEYA